MAIKIVTQRKTPSSTSTQHLTIEEVMCYVFKKIQK